MPWTALSAAHRPLAERSAAERGVQPDPCRPLPERGFNLTYLMTSLLLVLLMSAAMLRVLMPRLRRATARGSSATCCSGNPHLRAAAASWCSSWGVSVLVRLSARTLLSRLGQHGAGLEPVRSGGLQPSTWAGLSALSGHRPAGELHEDRHLRVPLAWGRSRQPAGLLHILLDQHPVLPVLAVLGLLYLCWRFALSRWICARPPPPLPPSSLCVFATQTGNKLLGANIRYVDRGR